MLVSFGQEKEKAIAAAKLGALGLAVLAQEDDGDDGVDFVGGLPRLDLPFDTRNKALAAAGMAHLKPRTVYTTVLFDHALEKPTSKAYRAPNVGEIVAADRQAWSEILRLVEAKSGTIDSCGLHVCKAGGLVGSLLRPVPCEAKQTPARSFALRSRLLFMCHCGFAWQVRDDSWKDGWKSKASESWKSDSWNSDSWKTTGKDGSSWKKETLSLAFVHHLL